MFAIARAEIGTRILDTKQLITLVRTFEVPNPLEAALCKGLIFVQLYGAYEYAVQSSVQGILLSIRNDGLAPRDLHARSLTLVLDSAFLSASTAGPRRLWARRLGLVSRFDDSSPLQALDNTLFPADGTHYRVGQLQTIWDIFGVSVPVVPEARLLGRIDELVENRNSIAHGRQRPEQVGRRYSIQEVERRIDDVEKIAMHIVSVLETHYTNGGVRR
jgi:hypothetical protein